MFVAAEDPETVERYRALAMAIADATASLSDILAYMRQLNTTVDAADGSVTRAERALERVQQLVDNAQVILDDDGRRLLEQAMEEQKETGQQSQQLTDMAHEARWIVDQYVKSMLSDIFFCLMRLLDRNRSLLHVSTSAS